MCIGTWLDSNGPVVVDQLLHVPPPWGLLKTPPSQADTGMGPR
jgi:hypothetical protein